MKELTANIGRPNQNLASVAIHDRRRLLAFIRARVPSDVDAEDLLQDVFCDLVDAYNAMKPIGRAGACMMQVARNRIADLFRSRRPQASQDVATIADLLPSRDAGPDAILARSVLVAELEQALEELPASQRDVFLAHEVSGRSFAQIAAETGLSVNTLLSRKHYAAKRLRVRLLRVYREAGIERKEK
jgi:RNA polymerase sigma factor (sigma-70 family)